MGVDINTQVGPQRAADGVSVDIRQAKSAELVVVDAHGRYHEPGSRGLIFSAANQAAVASPAGLTAASVNFTLYNPIGSGYLLSLLNIAIALGAAPVAATAIWLVGNLNPAAAAPATVTLLNIINNLLNSQSGVGKAYSTATLPAAPVIIRPLAFVDAASNNAAGSFKDEVAGAIIIPPGCAVSIQALTAVSLFAAMDWEEIPII